MTQIFHVSTNDILVDSVIIKSINWISALLYSQLSEYRQSKSIARVSSWGIEIDAKDNLIKRKIGFDIPKRPINGLSNIKLKLNNVVSQIMRLILNYKTLKFNNINIYI
jgi:hypothetical protein